MTTKSDFKHGSESQSLKSKGPAIQQAKDEIRIPANEAISFVERILIKYGVRPDNANLIGRCLVAADLRGVESHGVGRIPSYLERIRKDVLDPHAEPLINEITPAVAQVDGQNGFGFIAAHAGMQKAIEMAQMIGIGMVSVKHSNHFGMSAWIVQQAVDAGFMCLVFTNSSPALPVYGGKQPLIGVSPIACGAPGSKSKNNPDGCRPFILDMAPSVAARGKIYRAARLGQSIPSDWALDEQGNPTSDPTAALKGTMLPMGGPKGSALSIMMDVFSGVLSGSAFAGNVPNPHDASKEANVGHFLIAIKPDLFMSHDEFVKRMEYLYCRVVDSPKAPDVERIFFPGEIEQMKEEERRQNGIPYKKSEIDVLNLEADAVNVSPLQNSYLKTN